MMNSHAHGRSFARLVCSASIVFLAGVASAGSASQTELLRPDDAAEFDSFGNSVAIAGSNAVIGASNKAGISGFPRGAAYVFDMATGGQLFRLIPSDTFDLDYFGQSVSVSGTTAIVGAPRPFGSHPTLFGSAYLFDTTTGIQQHNLVSTDNAVSDRFGHSVDIDDVFAISGSPGNSDNGTESGSAYVFHAPSGMQLHKLLPGDGAAGDQFGNAVAISGLTAVIGAWGNSDNGAGSGSAYVFDTSLGTQLHKLLPDDGAVGDRFGQSVAISGSIAIVGASGDQDNGANSGSAYLFDTASGLQLFKLVPSDGGTEHRFGSSVGISGSTAIVGAQGHDQHGGFAGAVYMFDTATGQQTGRFFSDEISVADEFGIAVSIDGTDVVIGAYQESNDFANDGTAYSFDISTCAAADINNDGTIDTADLGILITQFGSAGPGADINGDGVVDTADLGILIGIFGDSCP